MDFNWDAHAGNFLRSLVHPGLPAQYTRADTQRVTLAYFCVVGLDLLGKLGTCSEAERAAVIEWVLAQFVLPGGSGLQWQRCGFRGGSFGGKHFVNAGQKLADAPDFHKNKTDGSSVVRREDEMDEGNLAMTYSALATLITLEADLADVDGDAIVRALGSLQQEDGSFRASPSDRTCDLRFTYCACAVSTILGNWDGVDRRKAADYIEKCYAIFLAATTAVYSVFSTLLSRVSLPSAVVSALAAAKSQGFDGGIGLSPGRESCAGPTFCAVASMKLMGTLDTIAATRREGLLEWCVNRQGTGFQGRPNKVDDCCCSFWVGATLALLGGLHLVDKARAREFHVSCQNKVLGGFAKAPGEPPDLLHSFYSLCWLSLSKEEGLEPMDAALGITRRAGARATSDIDVRATH